MSDCICAMRCFRKFLVVFWGIFWAAALVSNFIGAGQYWGWFGGIGLKGNYVAINHALAQMHGFSFLPNIFFVLSLVLQVVVVYYFVKAFINTFKEGEYTGAVSAFVMAVSVFLLLYAAKLILLAMGVTIDHFATSAFYLIVMQFLALIYVMLETRCCK